MTQLQSLLLSVSPVHVRKVSEYAFRLREPALGLLARSKPEVRIIELMVEIEEELKRGRK